MYSSDYGAQRYWAKVVEWRDYPPFSSAWNIYLKANFKMPSDYEAYNILHFRLLQNPHLDEVTKLAALGEIYDIQDNEDSFIEYLTERGHEKEGLSLIRYLFKQGVGNENFILNSFSSALLNQVNKYCATGELSINVEGFDPFKTITWMNTQKIDGFFLRAPIYNAMEFSAILSMFNALSTTRDQVQMLLCLSHTQYSQFIVTLDQKQYEDLIDELLKYWRKETFITRKMQFFSDVFKFKAHNKSLYLFQKLSFGDGPGNDGLLAIPRLTWQAYISDEFYASWETDIEKLLEEGQKFKLLSGVIYNNYHSKRARTSIHDKIDELNKIADYLKKNGLLLKYIRQFQQDVVDAIAVCATLDRLPHYVLISHLTVAQANELFDPRKINNIGDALYRYTNFCNDFFYEAIPLARNEEVIQSGFQFPKHLILGDASAAPTFLYFERQLALFACCESSLFVNYFNARNLGWFIDRIESKILSSKLVIDDGVERQLILDAQLHMHFLAQIIKSGDQKLINILLSKEDFLSTSGKAIFVGRKDKSPLSLAFYEEFFSVKTPGKAIEMLLTLKPSEQGSTTASTEPLVNLTEASEKKADPRHAFVFCLLQSFCEVEVKGETTAEFNKFLDHLLNDAELFNGYFKSAYFTGDLQVKYIAPIFEKCTIAQAALIIENSKAEPINQYMRILQESRGRLFVSELLEFMASESRDKVIQALAENWFNHWKIDDLIPVLALARNYKVKLPEHMLESICRSVHWEKLEKHQFIFYAFFGEKNIEEIKAMIPNAPNRTVLGMVPDILNSPHQEIISCNFAYYFPIVDYVEKFSLRPRLMRVCKNWFDYYSGESVPVITGLNPDVSQLILEFLSPKIFVFGGINIDINSLLVSTFFTDKFIKQNHQFVQRRGGIKLEIDEKDQGIWLDVFWGRNTATSPMITGDDQQKQEAIASIICNAICWKYFNRAQSEKKDQENSQSQQRQ